MSRRQLKTDDEGGFLLAFCDELSDCEHLFACQIEVVLLRSSKRGSVHINCIAYKTPRRPSDAPLCVTNTEYPSASAARLHAALYRASIRIGGELAKLARDKELEQLATA